MLRMSTVLLLLPAVYRDSYQKVWERRIRFTLKGELPSRIVDLKTYEDIWTDYVIDMQFKAEPTSVRRILESAKFRRSRIPDKGHLEFEPVDLPENVLHRVTVTTDYSQVWIEYAAD